MLRFMFWRAAVSFVATALYILFLELAGHFTGGLAWFLAGAAAAPLLAAFFLRRSAAGSGRSTIWRRFSFVFFVLGGLALYLFVDRFFNRQLLVFFTASFIFLYLFFNSLFLSGQAAAENVARAVSEVMTVAAFFFLVSFFFGWQVFLTSRLSLVIILTAAVAFILSREFFLETKAAKTVLRAVWAAAALLSAEFFWALQLLPVGFLVKGMILSLLWWTAIKAFQENFSERRARKVMLAWLLAGVLGSAALLLAGRWI